MAHSEREKTPIISMDFTERFEAEIERRGLEAEYYSDRFDLSNINNTIGFLFYIGAPVEEFTQSDFEDLFPEVPEPFRFITPEYYRDNISEIDAVKIGSIFVFLGNFFFDDFFYNTPFDEIDDDILYGDGVSYVTWIDSHEDFIQDKIKELFLNAKSHPNIPVELLMELS